MLTQFETPNTTFEVAGSGGGGLQCPRFNPDDRITVVMGDQQAVVVAQMGKTKNVSFTVNGNTATASNVEVPQASPSLVCSGTYECVSPQGTVSGTVSNSGGPCVLTVGGMMLLLDANGNAVSGGVAIGSYTTVGGRLSTITVSGIVGVCTSRDTVPQTVTVTPDGTQQLTLSIGTGASACTSTLKPVTDCTAANQKLDTCRLMHLDPCDPCLAACTLKAACATLWGATNMFDPVAVKDLDDYVCCAGVCNDPQYKWKPGTLTAPDVTPDQVADFIDSISANKPAYTGDEIDLTGSGATTWDEDQGDPTLAAMDATDPDTNDLMFNHSIYECNTTRGGTMVVCPANVMPMPGGAVFVAATSLKGMVPMASNQRSYIYSLVLDSDGLPANNWLPQLPYDWDLFQGADRWYQLIWDHLGGKWSMTATQVDAMQHTSVVPTTARAAVNGTSITWFVSKSELPATNPGYRLTAFAHDGKFSVGSRGADVSGHNPTEPLSRPSPALVVPDAGVSLPDAGPADAAMMPDLSASGLTALAVGATVSGTTKPPRYDDQYTFTPAASGMYSIVFTNPAANLQMSFGEAPGFGFGCFLGGGGNWVKSLFLCECLTREHRVRVVHAAAA